MAKQPAQPLTDKQKKAVQMLYNDDRIQDIAAELGVHRTTIWRWQQKRAFWKEWHRIDRNLRRKYARQEAKRKAAEEAFWNAKLEKAEQRLHEIGIKAEQNPGKNPAKAYDKAWNAYGKALFHGRSWAEILSLWDGNEFKPRKRRRRSAARNKT